MDLDPNEIGNILNVAGQGTKTLGSALDLAQRVGKLFSKDTASPGEAELKALASDLAVQLTDARMKNLDVVNMLQQLQRTVELESQFQETRNLYQPKQLEAGGWVLVLRDPDPSGEYWPRICPNCAENDRKIFPLQGRENANSLHCDVCKGQFRNLPHQQLTRSSRGGFY